MDFLISPIIYHYWPAAVTGKAASTFNGYLKLNYSPSANIAGQLDALNGLYARAYQMLASADQLAGAEGRINFSQRPTRSSDTDVAKITYFDKTYSPAQTPESNFYLKVQQIARNQVNQGVSLDADDVSVINTGSNTFTLTVGGTGHDLAVTIAAGDTNATALAKIAQAIDTAGVGVSTSVVQEGGTAHLLLQGQTGEVNAFSLADTTGNAISASGVNTSTQTAQDAKFLVNGTTHIQADNEVSLLDGHLQVNLMGAGTALVTTGPMTAVDLVQSLTETMSSFGSYAANNSYLNSKLATAWNGLVAQEAGILSKYGLEAGSQGQVGLDTLKFTGELQNNISLTADAIGGLASRVKDFVQGLTSYPAVNLLAAPPTADYAAAYLRTSAAAPWLQPGTGFFRFFA